MELKGTQFILREWKKGDEIALQKHANNKNISRFLFDRFPNPYTLADAKEFVSGHLNQNPLRNFVISINDEVAGVIEFKPGLDIYRKTAVLGYWLGEPFWGNGIMTEAIALITGYAFKNFELLRIQSHVNANNPASMRVLEKAGFKKEGILKKAIFKDGVIMDEHVYGLCKE